MIKGPGRDFCEQYDVQKVPSEVLAACAALDHVLTGHDTICVGNLVISGRLVLTLYVSGHFENEHYKRAYTQPAPEEYTPTGIMRQMVMGDEPLYFAITDRPGALDIKKLRELVPELANKDVAQIRSHKLCVGKHVCLGTFGEQVNELVVENWKKLGLPEPPENLYEILTQVFTPVGDTISEGCASNDIEELIEKSKEEMPFGWTDFKNGQWVRQFKWVDTPSGEIFGEHNGKYLVPTGKKTYVDICDVTRFPHTTLEYTYTGIDAVNHKLLRHKVGKLYEIGYYGESDVSAMAMIDPNSRFGHKGKKYVFAVNMKVEKFTHKVPGVFDDPSDEMNLDTLQWSSDHANILPSVHGLFMGGSLESYFATRKNKKDRAEGRRCDGEGDLYDTVGIQILNPDGEVLVAEHTKREGLHTPGGSNKCGTLDSAVAQCFNEALEEFGVLIDPAMLLCDVRLPRVGVGGGEYASPDEARENMVQLCERPTLNIWKGPLRVLKGEDGELVNPNTHAPPTSYIGPSAYTLESARKCTFPACKDRHIIQDTKP